MAWTRRRQRGIGTLANLKVGEVGLGCPLRPSSRVPVPGHRLGPEWSRDRTHAQTPGQRPPSCHRGQLRVSSGSPPVPGPQTVPDGPGSQGPHGALFRLLPPLPPRAPGFRGQGSGLACSLQAGPGTFLWFLLSRVSHTEECRFSVFISPFYSLTAAFEPQAAYRSRLWPYPAPPGVSAGCPPRAGPSQAWSLARPLVCPLARSWAGASAEGPLGAGVGNGTAACARAPPTSPRQAALCGPLKGKRPAGPRQGSVRSGQGPHLVGPATAPVSCPVGSGDPPGHLRCTETGVRGACRHSLRSSGVSL